MSAAPHPMPALPDPHVLELLAPYAPWLGAPDTVFAPANSGVCNISFIVTRADGARFVLRQSRGDDPELGIMRIHEERALRALSASGLGPEIVAWHPHGHLLTTYIPHQPVAVDPGAQWLRSAAGVEALAEVLRGFHALPGNGKRFDPARDIAHRLAWAVDQPAVPVAAAAAIAALAAHVPHARAVADRVARERPGRAQLVHGDCFPGNLLHVGDGLRIIDVEFSGVGDGLYDLACLGFGLGDEATRELVARYEPGSADEVARTRDALHRYQYLAGVWDAAWALVQLSRARPGHDYTGHLAYVVGWANGHPVFTGRSSG